METHRSAIVTGGSAGIGLAIADMLADEGWDLTLVARDPAKLEAAAGMLAVHGTQVQTHPANLADPDAAAQVGLAHLDRFGRLDMLVNNAGIGLVGPIERKTGKQLDLELSLNFKASYIILQSCIAPLKKAAAEHGASYVINVSSMAARENGPNASVYAATKAALVSLSNVAHAELSRSGVHVTALLPGFVDTPGTGWADSGIRDQMFDAADVAEAVRFLVRTSPRCFVPEIMMTTAGPSIWHSPLDWDTAST
ncbi:SDR family NAD(P)-dependent oxidoreductase [Nocardia sp. FBN12]|uniref:SDR family NAD(P)-dependent oxidoreductase n=1 Tax=Nocardia sp. FBN12 TaxID=3419766 RepID=UPI003D0864D9